MEYSNQTSYFVSEIMWDAGGIQGLISLGQPLYLKDHVTFASHVALAAHCTVGENSYLGTNSTVRDGTILAKGTLVGLGTTIIKNTEEWSVYVGNPAKKIGNNISKSILKI